LPLPRARLALAALHPFSPDLRPYWDRFEVGENDLDRLIDILTTRRQRPRQRHPSARLDEQASPSRS
jgi:hypothetical protein